MQTQNKKEGIEMKKTYVRAKAQIVSLGKEDILTLSGFTGKDDVFPLSNEENEEENASV